MKIMNIRYLTILSLLVLASCTTTSITDSWKEETLTKSYSHPMIIGISDSQQTRQVFEKHLVAELKKKDVQATPSYTIINSRQKVTRETVLDAVRGTDIDSVLVTYLVSADAEMKHHDSPVNTGYSGDVENNMISDTLVSNRGRSKSTEIIGLKNDFYDAQSKKVVWSVRTKSVAPESIDEVVTDVTSILVDRLFSDEILN